MDRGSSEHSNVRELLVPGLLSAALLWLAFPPMGWWPLAWIAPVGWFWLARLPQLPARRPYFWIYLTGAAFWLVYLQGIRLAHWALIFGWLALALYLACYTPLLVAFIRRLVHGCRVPLPVAAALTWTALECVRAYVATGFGGGMLAHSQTPCLQLLQSASWFGTHGLSLLMAFVAGALVEAVWLGCSRAESRRWQVAAWLLVALVATAGNVVWGTLALRNYETQFAYASGNSDETQPSLKMLLVQESVDTIFEYNPQRSVDTFAQYRRATLEALRADADVNVVVWPESVFTSDTPDYLGGDPRHPELRRLRLAFHDKLERLLGEMNRIRQDSVTPTPDSAGTWLIAGTVTVDLDHNPPREYNSALLIDPTGKVAGRYYKNHLVMFGEYIPGGSWLPWLYRVTPMPNGLAAGDGPEPFTIRGLRLSPTICFESMVPQLVNRQYDELARSKAAPDALVNVTNDGWFWGSSILDTHFQASVFRAIEHRRPLLVAANTGLSSVVDPTGRVVARGDHRAAATLRASITTPVVSSTPFHTLGDGLGFACVAVVASGCVVSWWRSRRATESRDSSEKVRA